VLIFRRIFRWVSQTRIISSSESFGRYPVIGIVFKGRELTSSHNNANQSTHAEIDEDNQHEDDVESNELKQIKENAEEEQEIVQKAPGFGIPSMAISPTDTTLHKRHSSVSFFFVFDAFSFFC